MTTSATLEPGRLLRAYRIEERLGAGAQAVTWRATDTRDGRVVAIKQFALSRAESWKDVELFRRECAVLATLSHPAVPAFVEAFEETHDGGDTELYLVQTYVAAPSIAALMRDGRRWSQGDLVDTARRLLIIVGWLHMRSPPVVHRDIKPSNILRHADARLTLIDFTAVQSRLHSAPEGGSTVVGTHGYMAPEQLLGRAAPASDLYAIGMTLVHMASGHHPSELPLAGLRVDFRPVVRLDAGFVGWLERMTAPDPDSRPPSAEAALQDLERSLTPPVPPRTTPRPIPLTPVPASARTVATPRPASRATPPKRRRVWMIGAGALAVVLLIILLGGRGKSPPQPATSGVTAGTSPTPRTTGPGATPGPKQFQDVTAEVKAPPGIDVAVRAARLRLGGGSGEATTIDLAYLLRANDAPIERVTIRATAHAVGSQSATHLEPVSLAQVPLEPGETRREWSQLYDTPRSVQKVVLDVTYTPRATPLPSATRTPLTIEGLAGLPPGVGATLVLRRALRIDEGLSQPRMAFDVELALSGTDKLFALTLVPTCVTPAGPRPRMNDRDFTVLTQSLAVQTLYDGEVSTFRVLCPTDASAVTWALKSAMRR